MITTANDASSQFNNFELPFGEFLLKFEIEINFLIILSKGSSKLNCEDVSLQILI